jgi:hypothetical protein
VADNGSLMDKPRDRLARRIRWYSEANREAPTHSALLARTADDILAGGPAWEVLRGREDDPRGSALALRYMGAIHRLVLRGEAPELAPFYRTVGGSQGPEGAWEALRKVLESHVDRLREEVTRPVQTNEVGRSGTLVGGFLSVADRFGLPLRVLELGASAGLNLRWDHFNYEARGERWGPTDSPVRLCDFDTPPTPPFDVQTTVAERRGCDKNPLDPSSEQDRLTLLSFVWCDQAWRVRRLRAAFEVAAQVPATVDRANAPEWLEQQLGKDRTGVASVVFHSIFMQYLTEADRERTLDVIRIAGESATADTPVAWLRMEPAGDHADLHLTTWPRGEERLLAHSGFHGANVRWVG